MSRTISCKHISMITRPGSLLLAASLMAILLASCSHRDKATLPVGVMPSPTGAPSIPDPSNPARLARPIVSGNPAQVESGHLIYWGVCMACHGDRGQGLTNEWRDAYGEDRDCWHSGCHGKHHPPQGFEIPKTLIIPPLASPGALSRFSNAQQLYDYVVAMMPWWKPDSLGREKAWQVTAYLLQMKGSLPEGLVLNETTASAVPVHRHISPPHNDQAAALFFAGILVLAGLGMVAQAALTNRPSDPAAGFQAARGAKIRVRRPSFIAHLHPPTMPAAQARWRYTLGAGGLAVFLSFILAATGLLETFYYIPTPEKAAISIQTINNFVPFGALVRNLHYWSAQILVLVAAIHLLRVVFTGAYAAPRRFNFLLGLSLLALVLLLDFTGYVLRWDEGVRWALLAGTNLLKSIPIAGERLYEFAVGGSQAGPAALVRFYAWHVFALSPACGIALLWHLFRVRRDGGIAAPPAAQRENRQRITRLELLRREGLAMIAAGAVLVILAALAPAPIAAPLQAEAAQAADTRAPWFFLWVQQLLKLGDPFLLGILVPLGLLIGVGLLPYLLPGPLASEAGRWFPRSGRTAQIILAAVILVIAGLTILAVITP